MLRVLLRSLLRSLSSDSLLQQRCGNERGITKLSASLSNVVATWIRPAKNADTEQPIVMKSGLHRTFFEDPSATLARAGAWRLNSQHSIEKWGAGLGVAVPASPVGGGYWLTSHSI